MKENTILIIGSGGREHALGWKLKQSSNVSQIFFAPGNAGTNQIGKNINIQSENINDLLKFAQENKIDLTLVGPEAPLVLGIVDLFKKNGLKIIGPSKKASLIEASKIFAKQLMKKYHIPSADFMYFADFNQAKKYLLCAKYPLVIKADGLCAGKGVMVCKNKKQAIKFLKQLMVNRIFGQSANRIVIEECLTGQEVSFMVVTDGKNFLSFLPSQDHKRLKDKDLGPNTGGMGAYAPVPFVNKKLIKEIEKNIIAPTISALAKENCFYQGILYPGIILTANGPKVLEFNCRFGDPETQPLMMMLKSNLLSILLSIIKGSVNEQKLFFKSGASVCVVLASGGYPEDYKKGEEIYGLNKIKDKNLVVFQAGTKEENRKVVANGGRVLGITSYGKNIKEAIKKVYQVIGKQGVWFNKMTYRKDIAQKAFLKKI
ncbi:phosphoribosylamine--glycine ligase [Candidatus Roizmanbacteria bacterium CG22_combo_CG10-13_8_21_14_all_35_9]|uniref:Phosphoribosylamine--glycine ligase n=1 Tax=Candidatus Roizmanbacteria bacterium CG22_combo_CG10-13_8_21_14_all_35_9 TaxID=1974861 RepID=A0A2H0C050_9BACT|nr:MAG: phosphoribosylamine--glycine ligase [Candidatus Roizmanbacteria bacterium CG22_combo_CG10-13_8_21_14_all_35_9]PJC82375.1 MAG: phosphoribosylamine--glycine ligase [Candidatus Roizmanbacteria bacterium CG_4_8_14_3_um_filter_35_14]